MKEICVCSPDLEWANNLASKLKPEGYFVSCVISGRECQQLLSTKKQNYLILDIETTGHSSFEILKFIKLSHLPVEVILYGRTPDILTKFEIDIDTLKRLGVNQTFFSASAIKKISEYLLSSDPARWRNVKAAESEIVQHQKKVQDKLFTRIGIQELAGSNIAIFDHYIRLATDTYVKFVNQGMTFDKDRMEKLAKEGVEYLYFLTSDRIVYINYINEVIKKNNESPLHKEKTPALIKNVAEKYIEEIYTNGLKPELAVEGKSIANNMYNLLNKDLQIAQKMDELSQTAPSAFSHSFLVSFFSTVICKNLQWVSSRTIESVVMGALLHDIGLLQISPHLQMKDYESMSPSEKAQYELHPRFGYEMLCKSSSVNEQVRQIVLQHHELASSLGYPLKLTNVRIFPLAKIVAFADHIVEIMSKKKVSPIEATKMLLIDKDDVRNYDSEVVRALVYSLMGKR